MEQLKKQKVLQIEENLKHKMQNLLGEENKHVQGGFRYRAEKLRCIRFCFKELRSVAIQSGCGGGLSEGQYQSEARPAPDSQAGAKPRYWNQISAGIETAAGTDENGAQGRKPKEENGREEAPVCVETAKKERKA